MPLIKLGSPGVCPVTGAHGWLTKFIGDVPIYRASDGTMFKGKSKSGRKPLAGQPCRVRIKGVPDAPWMEGVRVTKRSARVLTDDPVWKGAVVSVNDAEIREVGQ